MKKFETPEIVVEIFCIEDIITTSGNVSIPAKNDLELPDEAF